MATELIGAAYVFGRVTHLVLVDLVVYSALLLILLIATLWLYRAITLPLSELAGSVRANATLGRPAPLSITGPKEIVDLSEDINALMATVALQVADRDWVEVRSHARLDGSLDAIISMDHCGDVAEWNRQAELTFGWTRSEVIGKQLALLIIPERYRERHRQGLARYLRTGTGPVLGKSVELEALAKDGREFPIELSIVPMHTPTGEMFSASIRDLSERRDAVSAQATLEGQLRQAQRLETVGQLAGGLAHDFNNLLAVILNYAEFVSEQLPEGEMRQDVEEIQRAAKRGADLTRQLLIFARRELNRPELLNVNDVITGVENVLRRTLGAHVEFVKSLASDLPAVRADPGQLEQIFLNLAVNSRDAMPGGGRLLVETAVVDLDAKYVEAHHGAAVGRFVRLTVSDTGSGMAPEVAARAFEPFFTTKSTGHGTGLGLATVYGIVTQAGGNIRIYSKEGSGTLIAIHLPAVDEKVTRQTRPAADAPAKGSAETVLVVEDEAPVLLSTVRILSSNRYTVLAESVPAHALALLANTDRHIDVLLTDIVMPLMSGIELAKRARELRPELKVLYMSGYSSEMISRQGRLNAGSCLLLKPFSRADLLQGIRDVLGQDQPVAEEQAALEPSTLLDPTA